MRQKYNVLMACGAGFFGVKCVPSEEDQTFPFMTWVNDGTLSRPPKHEDGKPARCLECKCRRKAKRKQDMFFKDSDTTRPTGISVCCFVDKIEEVEL